MFIGHFAAGMAGKKVSPGISLGTLFFAAQFLDLLWPTLLLLGLEQVAIVPGISNVTPLHFIHYPISHSLLTVMLWGGLFGAVYFAFTKHASGALLLGGLVVSHWILDVVVHIPDLPLYPGDSAKIGLGVWNSLALTVLTEGTLFIAGIILYVRAKRKSGQKITWRFVSLLFFLAIIYAMNIIGPPPPDVTAIAWAGHLQWLFIPWAWWADRN